MDIELGPSIQHVQTLCGACGKTLSGSTGVQAGAPFPKRGDISICSYCGNLALYNEDLTLRQPEPEEMQRILDEIKANDPDVVQFISKSQLYFHENSRRPKG